MLCFHFCYRDEQGIKSRKVNLEAKPDKRYEERLHDTFSLAFGPTPKWANLDSVLGHANVSTRTRNRAIFSFMLFFKLYFTKITFCSFVKLVNY